MPPDENQCNKKTDMIFVLDRSGSIKPSDYDQMRKFLIIIGKRLKVGETNEDGEVIGQAGIVTFSERGERRLFLKDSKRPGRFASTVERMPGPNSGGRTKTHLGLAVADKDVAVRSRGFRVDDPDVKKMLMIITDGEQTRGGRGYKYVGDAVKPFFARDMDIFAVGVGLNKQKAIDQVRDMVEVQDNAILAKNYKDLTMTVEDFMKKLCPGKVLYIVSCRFCFTYAMFTQLQSLH